MTASAATPLNRQQILGFWAAWFGWMLDGMDSVIYALVLSPAMKELLPKSGLANSPADIAFAGSILFALFLVGWGLSFIWGPLADRFGRAKCLAATILIFSVFTGAAAFAQNVWELGFFRLPGRHRHRRRMGDGGHLSSPRPGRKTAARKARAICRPAITRASSWRRRSTSPSARRSAGAPCSCAARRRSWWRSLPCRACKEPPRWERAHAGPRSHPLAMIFSGVYLRRTIVNTALVSIAIVGLWAGTVYEPTAILTLAKAAGFTAAQGTKLASLGTGVLSHRHHIGMSAGAASWRNGSAARKPWRCISPAWRRPSCSPSAGPFICATG